MDYSIFILILFVIIAIGSVFGIGYLRKNGYVKSEDLLFVIKTFDLTISILDELNIRNESQIKSLANMVLDGLKFAYQVDGRPIAEIKLLALEYVLQLAELNKITITQNRLAIIQQLIDLGLAQKLNYPMGRNPIF